MYWIYWEYHNIFTLFFIFSGARELHTFVRSQIVAVRCFFAIYNCRNVSHSVVGCGLNFSTKKSNLVKKFLATTLNDIISSFWLTIDTPFCFFLISSVLFCFIYFCRWISCLLWWCLQSKQQQQQCSSQCSSQWKQ